MKDIIIEYIEYLYYAEGIDDVEELIEHLKTHDYIPMGGKDNE